MTQKPLTLAVETSGRTGSVAIAVGRQLLAETHFSTPIRHSAEIFPAVQNLLGRFGRKPKEIKHIYISVGPGSFTGLRIAVTMAKTMLLANSTGGPVKIVAVDTLDVIAANVTTKNSIPDSSHEPRASLVRHSFPVLRPVRRSFSEDGSFSEGGSDGGSIECIAAILDAKRSQFFIAVYQQRASLVRRLVLRPVRRSFSEDGSFSEGGSDGGSHEPQNTQHAIWEKIFPDSLLTADEFLEKFAGRDKPIWLLGEGLVYYKDKFKAEGIRFLNEKYWTPHAEKVHLLGWQKAQANQFADPLTLTPLYLRKPDVKVKQNTKQKPGAGKKTGGFQ